MKNLTAKVTLPIILAGLFTATVFLALGQANPGPGFYLVLLLLLIYFYFYGMLVSQRLKDPIQKLSKKATELRRGNFSSRIYLDTKDELSELSQIFNDLAEKLEKSVSDQDEAVKEVDIKIKAKTRDLEESIEALEEKVKNRTIELERSFVQTERLEGELKEKENEILQLKKQTEALKARKQSKTKKTAKNKRIK